MIDYEIPSDSHHYLFMLYIPSGGPTFWDPEALTVMGPMATSGGSTFLGPLSLNCYGTPFAISNNWSTSNSKRDMLPL